MEISKYKKGEFGYWWTIKKGNEDIEGQAYDGDIACNNKRLTSLKGAPKEVSGNFDCDENKLTSLEYCPQKVGGNFWCCSNELTSLEGCPQEVGKGFNCSDNKLISLKGCPQEVGSYFICGANELTSLEGSPEKVGGDFICSYNNLISLEEGPKEIGGEFICNNNNQATYILASRYEDDEWYTIYATYKTLEEAKKDWKKELKSFFEYGPDDCTSLILAKCELSEEQFNKLQDHIKQCDVDDMHMYDEEFTAFMREIFYDHGDKIHWEGCDGVFEIHERAEDNGEDPEDNKVFTKYFDQYFECHY